jgi:hypothetical protein
MQPMVWSIEMVEISPGKLGCVFSSKRLGYVDSSHMSYLEFLVLNGQNGAVSFCELAGVAGQQDSAICHKSYC